MDAGLIQSSSAIPKDRDPAKPAESRATSGKMQICILRAESVRTSDPFGPAILAGSAARLERRVEEFALYLGDHAVHEAGAEYQQTSCIPLVDGGAKQHLTFLIRTVGSTFAAMSRCRGLASSICYLPRRSPGLGCCQVGSASVDIRDELPGWGGGIRTSASYADSPRLSA
jgi:hypothetical protein